jgi:DNA polymerase III subunit alpha
MHDVVALGLLKIDFLGLRNLDVIDQAVELVGDLDIQSIPLDDPKTYEMLQRGDAIGVFQFESSGMREALRQVKPTRFDDLVALVALYRPGPMQYIPVYARRKNGQDEVTYSDPRLEPITGDSYGICIYQEQYMRIAKEIAGFTPAEAETLRYAIGKKVHKLMASLEGQFREGCAASGTAPAVVDQLWNDMQQSKDYSFNKAHAACYALIAYRTAWLRAHHPHEYMAALISSVMSTKDRVPFYVNACDELGVEVLPPDVNASQVDFAVVEGKIRFGLNAVKNVGEAACVAIVSAREAGGSFASIWDFTERVDPQIVNKRALESLVKCGALDSTGASRKGMVDVLDQALSWGGSEHEARSSGQSSIFDLVEEGGERPRHHAPIAPEEYEKSELLRLEKETLGLWISEHPLAEVAGELKRKCDRALSDLERCRDGEIVTVGGIVSSVTQLTRMLGDPMVFLRLDDLSGSAEAVVFNSVYASSRELCEADRVLVLKGRVDHKEGESKLIAIEVTEFAAYVPPTEVRLKVDARKAPAGVLRELGHVVRDYPGEARIVLALDTSEGPRTLEFGPEYRVAPVPDFYAEVKALLGEAAVT